MTIGLSACIELLFADEPDFVRRIARAAAAGFDGIEFWRWSDKDLDAVRREAERAAVGVVALCAEPFGELDLVDPGTHGAFLAGFERSCRAANRVGARNVVVLAGYADPERARESQRESLREVLQAAAAIAERHRVTLLLEPLSEADGRSGYFLHDTEEAMGIIAAVARPQVRLLYDRYHTLRSGEATGYGLQHRRHLLGHVHLADVPGRHEPGTGPTDWRAELASLLGGYQGFVGLEYLPTTDPATVVDRLRPLIDAAQGTSS